MTSILKSFKNVLQMAPTATLAAVSLAEALSKISLTPYLISHGKSAWPGGGFKSSSTTFVQAYGDIRS
jgi:hypothetical protein